MIDANVFARYMTAIADRLKFPLADGTNALYYVTLSKSLTTEQFEAAAQRVFAEYDQFGFPPASVFLAYARGTPVFDTDAVCREIMRHGVYLPTMGNIAPHVGKVRETMGDVVADAYATVGRERLFAEDETTRSIARRDFNNLLTEYAATDEHKRPLIASTPNARAISDRMQRPEDIAAIVQRALPKGTAA